MSIMSMKTAALSLLLACVGCASAPPVVSDDQREAFQTVVREAEVAGAATEPPEAARLLRDAKSEFEYGQRIPRDPEHARCVLTKAQADAEAALALARRRQADLAAQKVLARQEFALPAGTP